MNVQHSPMDELDLKIIAHLQEDGRKSFREIADDVGVTERTVRLRVAQLRENDVMQIVGVVNPIALGLQVVAIVHLDVESVMLEECIHKLQDMAEVRFITLVSGDYQLVLQVISQSYESLVRFQTDRMKELRGVRRANMMIELQVYKNDFRYIREGQIVGSQTLGVM